MKLTYCTTPRGFPYMRFTDRSGLECSIQKSSLMTDDVIWLGYDNVVPMSMIPFGQPGAHPWQLYPLPAHVHIFARMELTKEHAAALLPVLEHFVATGELPHFEYDSERGKVE